MLETSTARLRAEFPPPLDADDASPGLDDAHLAVWDAVRHLFPAHAMVDQTGHGYLLVSWTMPGRRPGATYYAAPVILRIDAGLLLALWTTGPVERKAIARLQERTVRQALADHEPSSRVPTLGVVELGSEAFA